MTAKLLVGLALLAMSEDVEIMRQMVEQAVNDVYKNVDVYKDASVAWRISGAPPNRDFIYTRPARSAHGGGQDVTGVYLPGYGVLIQLTAPMPFQEAVTVTKVERGAKKVSQWEVARRKLRGEFRIPLVEQLIVSAVPDSTHLPTRAQLTERMLDVLAENGHNFRELSPDERLTVDLVFRDRQVKKRTQLLEFQETPAGLLFVQPLQGKSADENAGDLHMRQKNYTKAVEAYEKAIKIKAARGKQPDAKDLPALYQKLAQAHVAAGQYKNAERLLKMLADGAAKQNTLWRGQQLLKAKEQLLKAKELLLKGKELKQSDLPAAKLPAHLIISATKSQLDAIAEGKMSRDEFAKAAQIEYLDPLEAAVEEKSDEGEPSKEN